MQSRRPRASCRPRQLLSSVLVSRGSRSLQSWLQIAVIPKVRSVLAASKEWVVPAALQERVWAAQTCPWSCSWSFPLCSRVLLHSWAHLCVSVPGTCSVPEWSCWMWPRQVIPCFSRGMNCGSCLGTKLGVRCGISLLPGWL